MAQRQKKQSIRKNRISNRANAVLNIAFIIWVLLCIIPIMLVLSISLSSQSSILSEGYRLFPSDFSNSAYVYLFKKSSLLIRAFLITIFVTVVGTVLSVVITLMYSYPLSRKSFKYRSFFSFVAFFTMIFQGGIVANYMVYTQVLHLKNNIFVYIFPFLISAWNVILLRTFITSSLPDELIDAAKIDGAGEWTILAKIVIPLSKPGLATIALFTSIGIWNDWYTPSLYVTDSTKFNLQYLLYSMITNVQYLKNNINSVGGANQMISNLPTESIRMAMCIVVIAPIVLAYPFFQKYFVKGLTLGAVKG